MKITHRIGNDPEKGEYHEYRTTLSNGKEYYVAILEKDKGKFVPEAQLRKRIKEAFQLREKELSK